MALIDLVFATGFLGMMLFAGPWVVVHPTMVSPATRGTREESESESKWSDK